MSTTERVIPDRDLDTFDVVVVGARCAGAPLATWLSRAGLRVAVVDRSTFPSDVLSTHVMFPDGLALLDGLGVLDRLRERHRLAFAQYSWRVLGHDVAGSFTPVGGIDRCLAVRRVSLDAILVEGAAEAGATMLLGHRVTSLLGTGTPADPVRGVVLDDGRVLSARWVVGADGQRSTVAGRLAVERVQERRGDVAMLLGYWRGLPQSDWVRLDMREANALMVTPCEDGIHLLTVAGDPSFTRGSRSDLEKRYHEVLRTFPSVLNPRLLDRAQLIGPVVGAPETMMRGYFRRAAGPGWALVGDAVHFKHPTTGQGIGDALAQAKYVADALGAGGDLDGYEKWLSERSAEGYDFSFRVARLPGKEANGLYAGLAADHEAAQGFLDTFTRRARVTDVLTAERVGRWRAAAAYEDGYRRVLALLEKQSGTAFATRVPACPDWSVRDLVAHLTGVADDATNGAYFQDALDAWRSDELAVAREEWTAAHVTARDAADPARLLGDLQRHGQAYVAALRSGDPVACGVPAWQMHSPAADLAVHLEDLHEALGVPSAPDAVVTRAGFSGYREWLGARIASSGLAPLRLADGTSEWLVGGQGAPGASLVGSRHELFRAISGRRSLDRVREMAGGGDLTAYLPVLSPYPLPS